MSWNKQLSKVTTSFNSKLKELRRLHYLPVNVTEEIYYKTVVSSVTYFISVWSTSSPTVLQELDVLHARLAKLLMVSGRKCHSKILLRKLTGNQLATSIREEFYLGCTEYTMKAALELFPRSLQKRQVDRETLCNLKYPGAGKK